MAIALGCLLAGVAIARDPSEPEAVARIRADRSATLEVLQAQAMAAEQRAKDPVDRAWWRLAVAEFADEAEHPEPALESLARLLDEARQLGLRDLEFRANARMAAMLANRGRTPEALKLIDRMNLLAKHMQEPAWQAEVHYQRGVLDRKDGRPELAVRQFEKALANYEKVGDLYGKAHTLNAMGMIYGRIGQFAEALMKHNEALAIATRLDDRQEMARSHRLLGNLYRNLEDEELGAENMIRALGLLEERDRREGIALRGELGKSLLKSGRIDEALRYAEAAAEDAQLSGSPPNKVNAFTTLAEVRLAQGDMEGAKLWSDKAMTQFDSVALRDQVLLRLSELRVLSALGQYQEARTQGGRTVYDARRLGDKVLEREALDALSNVQLALGDAEAAFESRKAHAELDRELSLETASRKIAGLEADLNQQRVEAEKKLLERDNQIQGLRITRQRWFGIALVGAFLAVLGGWLLYPSDSVSRNASTPSSKPAGMSSRVFMPHWLKLQRHWIVPPIPIR
ncbi:MAG: tetratricopeptide repeat protein [Ahniella sp.]|nr:tetratricopeptide repeat protein [Ahniella sp.]